MHHPLLLSKCHNFIVIFAGIDDEDEDVYYDAALDDSDEEDNVFFSNSDVDAEITSDEDAESTDKETTNVGLIKLYMPLISAYILHV